MKDKKLVEKTYHKTIDSRTDKGQTHNIQITEGSQTETDQVRTSIASVLQAIPIHKPCCIRKESQKMQSFMENNPYEKDAYDRLRKLGSSREK